MSFIELTNAHGRKKITVSVEHVGTLSPEEVTHIRNHPEPSTTEKQTLVVMTWGGSFRALEDYDEVRRLMRLEAEK